MTEDNMASSAPAVAINAKPKPLVAYSVQADEYGCIRFARNGAQARRQGAAEMDIEWEDIISCRRAADFDQYAPGPVPEIALWKAGWRFLCCQCESPAHDDGLCQMIDGSAYCETCAPSSHDTGSVNAGPGRPK